MEIPYLIELQRQYGDDLVVLGVSVDDPAEKLKPYATEMKINYPLLVGNGRQDFQDAYGPFWGIPVTVFVVSRRPDPQEALGDCVEGTVRARDHSHCCSMMPLC